MRARILSTLSAGIASLFAFPLLAACGTIVAMKMGAATGYVFAIVVATSLAISIGLFRTLHDVLIVRWSDDPDPPLYGSRLAARLRRTVYFF